MMEMLVGLIFIFLVFAVCQIINYYSKNPFVYPYKHVKIDMTNKKISSADKEFDRFFIEMGYDSYNWVEEQERTVKQWKKGSELKLDNIMLFKKHRRKQYLKTIDDNNMFLFDFVKEQTRYKQTNYVKTPYKVIVTVNTISKSPKELIEHIDKLKEIDFAVPLEEYHSKSQRALMTNELRQLIKERDNYTCQICGRYMPDEVGLHIDHIVPVSKGGKSIPSNLQVLCDKCNLKKGKRT